MTSSLNRPRLIAAAMAAVALPALAACNSSSSTQAATATTGPASSSPAATSPAASNTGASSPAASSPAATAAGALTPPGTHLAVGQSATLGWVPAEIDLKPGAHKGLMIAVTVKSIEKGTIADFANVQLDAAQKKDTPYYVKVHFTALGSVAPPSDSDPAITLDGIDDRGQTQSSLIFLGTFDRCDDASAPKPFTSGKSYDTCLTYLVPGGGSIQKMQWANGPSNGTAVSAYFDKPVIWGQ
jgi:hypothetical protein